MSKSSGQFLVVEDLVERGFDPLDFRYSCLSASYRVPLTFSWDGMRRAAEGLRRVRENVRRLHGETRDLEASGSPASLGERFEAALADDFNMPGALAVAWEAIHEANRASSGHQKRALVDLILDFDRALELGLADHVAGEFVLPDEVSAMIQQRETARSARDWTAADALREAIRESGYEIRDTPSGTQWVRTAQESKVGRHT
jgi:cysteinyl-tRNA synthetase